MNVRFATLIGCLLSSLAWSAPESGEGDLPVLDLAPVTLVGTQLPPESGETRLFVDDWEWDFGGLDGVKFPGQILRQQPLIAGTTNNENDSNGGAGTASLNLRALGPSRTLTLIDGYRTTSNSSLGPQPGGFSNINLLPVAGIERITIFTGGGATAHGADAIGGAVNFDVTGNFRGAELSGFYGDTTSGGGETAGFTFLTGTSGADYDFVIGGSLIDRAAILARGRALTASADFRRFGGTDRRSTTLPGRIIYADDGDPTDVILRERIEVGQSLDDYRPTNPVEDRFDFSRFAPAVPALRTGSFHATLAHQINKANRFSALLLYGNSLQENALAPAPWTADGDLLEAINESPFVPLDEQGQPIKVLEYFNRSLPLGNLVQDWEQNALRLQLKVEGETVTDWQWQTGLVTSGVITSTDFRGIADSAEIAEATRQGRFNPFALPDATRPGVGGFDNPAVFQEAKIDLENAFFDSLLIADVRLRGAPGAIKGRDITIASGFEFRREGTDFEPDPFWGTGRNLGGFAPGAYNASRYVGAVYLEARLPIHRWLTLGGGGRVEAFHDTGTDPANPSTETHNHFLGTSLRGSALVQPIEALSFGASVESGFRAPSLYQSFGAAGAEFPVLNDPLGLTPEGRPTPVIFQGNPNLDPEKSVNWQLSASLEPHEAWEFTVEFYHVRLDDAIANGAQFQVDENIGVIRSGENNEGPLEQVNSQWLNVAELEVQGIVYTAAWRLLQSSRHRVGLQAEFNQFLRYDVQPAPGRSAVDFLGAYVDARSNSLSPGAVPVWKGRVRADWSFERFSSAAELNYVGSFNDDPAFTTGQQPRKVETHKTLDLLASYRTSPGFFLGQNWRLAGGVDNVFNELPPFIAGSLFDGYDSSTYSLAGRFWYLKIGKHF